MAAHGTFIWNELICTDQDACNEFYSELFGWERKEVNTGAGKPYSIFMKDGHIIGGMMSLADDDGSTSSHWEPYISVDDVDICVEKITRLGGEILTPPHDLPEVGRVSLIRDPSGATVALVAEKDSS